MTDPRPSSAQVLALTTRLAELLLAGGFEGTIGIDTCLRGVAQAYGRRADVAVLAETAFVEIDGRTRVVTQIPQMPQLDQVSAFKPWLTDVLSGTVPLARARDRLEAIAAMPVRYRLWQRLAGVVLFTVGFGLSIQQTWQEVWVTAVLGLVVGPIQVLAERSHRVAWLAPLLASTVVSTAVLGAAAHGWVRGGTIELMLPVLFVFIPGDSITMSAIEIAVGRVTAGAARLVQALATLAALGFGPVLATALLDAARTSLHTETVPADLGPWAGWVGWSLFTIGVMLVFGMRAADVRWVLPVVLGTYGVELLAVRAAGEVVGTFCAAAVMAGTCLRLGHHRQAPPAYVLYLAPFFVLTPGAHGLRGLEVWLGGTVRGIQDIAGMFALIVAIALGMLTAFSILPSRITERYSAPADNTAGTTPKPIE
ncbi:threonine/serine exporter ThrE family protein [Nocardia tengchongensis]|uniref:threonine/serine ThrE exporter family protein n=1 Tax=Nocardia tengchongensis TaxID=2055889 RepID=UPI0036ADE813